MTRKVATLWCIGLLVGSTLSAEAQVTPNYWPAFPYDPEIALGMKPMPTFRKLKGYAKYIPQQAPAEAWNQKVSKERVLGPDGVEMIPVSPYPLDQTETWITIDPSNPNNLIASSNDSRHNGQIAGQYFMAAYYSTDGGRTWLDSKTPENPYITVNIPQGIRATIFDPALFFDTQGRAYLAFGMTQSINGDYDEGDNGVFVTYSDDQGKTWEYGEPVSLQSNGTSNQPFEDKYLATADVGENSPYKDNLYIVWTRFKQQGGIYFSRSINRGQTWEGAFPMPGGNFGAYQSPVPVVGPEGNIYVAWRRENGDNTQAVVQVSKNGGLNWTGNGTVAQAVKTSGNTNSATGRNELVDKQRMRISSYPAMAADHSNGAHHGRVYVIQSGKEANGTPGIFMTYSDNAGQNWSQSKRIDGNKAGNDVYLPAVAVDPLTGTLGVLYYSSENDPDGNKGVDAYMALSSDGGNTFAYVRLTASTFFIDGPEDVSNQGNNFYWGDYTSMTAHGGKFFPCYWAPSSPQGDYRSLNVYTNILSKAPRPVVDQIAVVTTENPGTITLTWKDPASNLFGQQLGTFKVVIYRRVKGEGEFQKIGEVPGGTQTYTDNTTTDGVEYEYQFVVVAEDLESTAQTATGVAGGALKPMAPVMLVARPHEDGVEIEFESPEFHVDNTPFHDYFEVVLYSGEQKIGSVPVAGTGIQAGETGKVVFELPVKQFYNVSIKVVGKRGDKTTESDASQQKLTYAGSPLTTLLATFDTPDSVAYYTGPADDEKWGRTNAVSSSGEFSLTDSPSGNYRGVKNYEVVLAPVVVTPAAPSLSFEHIAMVDAGDNAEVLISDDFGNSWKWLRSYSRNSSSKFKATAAASEWDTQSLDISAYNGDTLYVKFALRTTVLTHDDGWYIDNVRLDALPVDVKGDAAPTAYLGASYPNPASGAVQIDYRLQHTAHVRLELFNSVGMSAAVLVDEVREAGLYTLPFNVDHLPNGVYFYRFTLGDGTTIVRQFSVVR